MIDVAGDFQRRYAAAFERWVAGHGEEALRSAYELGRSAVREGHSVLDLAAAHHDALLAAVGSRDERNPAAVIRASGEFFLEAVSAFEMVQRALQEARETAVIERRHAVVLRQLSSFLADASIALDASSSIGEMLQLVAEHAREVIGAERCHVWLELREDGSREAAAHADDAADVSPAEPRDSIAVSLTPLDGREIGSIQLFAKPPTEFTELDEAVLAQLAQMASAAVERTQLYRR
jgi:hypothetical protein